MNDPLIMPASLLQAADGRQFRAEEIMAIEVDKEGAFYVRHLDGSIEKIERESPPIRLPDGPLC